VEQFESAGEMALAFDHRASRDRSLTREPKVLDRLLLVVGTAIMIGEFSRNFAGTFAISGLFARRDPAMQLDLMACREPIVEHFLIKCVVELDFSRARGGARFRVVAIEPQRATRVCPRWNRAGPRPVPNHSRISYAVHRGVRRWGDTLRACFFARLEYDGISRRSRCAGASLLVRRYIGAKLEYTCNSHSGDRTGDFRALSLHPPSNYVAVALEIACVPLIRGLVIIALAFSVGNAILLAFRIRLEEQALGISYQLVFASRPRFVPRRRF